MGIGCFGEGSGRSDGQFERRERVMLEWFFEGRVEGVGEVRSGQALGCFPVEMIGGTSRIPGLRRDFVREKVSVRERGYRYRRHRGAWGQLRYRPASPSDRRPRAR